MGYEADDKKFNAANYVERRAQEVLHLLMPAQKQAILAEAGPKLRIGLVGPDILRLVATRMAMAEQGVGEEFPTASLVQGMIGAMKGFEDKIGEKPLSEVLPPDFEVARHVGSGYVESTTATKPDIRQR